MKLAVQPSRLSGRVRAPSSKSYTHRAFIVAALAAGESRIINPLISLDTRATIEGIKTLGAEVRQTGDEWVVIGKAGKISPISDTIDAMNSGTTLRILTAVAALSEKPVRLTGDQSLLRRPMGPLVEALTQLGAEGRCEGPDGRPPVMVGGGLEGGEVEITGAVSSQFISALLIAATQARDDVVIVLRDELRSKPYVRITLRVLEQAGARIKYGREMNWFKVKGQQTLNPSRMSIPGDFSSAAFPLGAGAITDSEVEVTHLDPNDVQGDQRIVEFLREFGAEVKVGRDSVAVLGGALSGTELDCGDTPDLVPVLAVTGAVADGRTEILNVPHLRVKESDRIKSLAVGLSKMGARVRELPDGLRIEGGRGLRGTTVSSFGDHRIAMALAVAGLVARGRTVVEGVESIPVSYPGFVVDMRSLGAKIEEIS